MRLLPLVLLVGCLTGLGGGVPDPETGSVLHQPLHERMSGRQPVVDALLGRGL